MNTFDEMLQSGFEDLAEHAPHRQDLAQEIRRRSRYRRAVTVAPLAAAAAVAAVVGAVVLLRPAAVDPAVPFVSACSPIRTEVLPTWARAGFTDPEPRMPVVTSKGGAMLAIIFADPLVSPAQPDVGNKILWASEAASADHPLVISGRLERGTQTMTATVDGGGGPSIIDVPAPGCWLFDLTWANHHDTIDIPYATP